MKLHWKSQNRKIAKSQNSQRGYMLITLMLALALMTLAMLVAIPNFRQQITRDREEEMRHRGTSYMRAIQHFYKKFGRYPTKIEELENTNNVRFLRRRYTDPMNRDPATGKERDFKFLHQQDIMLNSGPALAGLGGAPGAPGAGGLQGPAAGLLAGLAGAGQPNGLQASAPSNLNSPASDTSSENSSGAPGAPKTEDPSVANPNGSASGSGGNGFNGPTFGGGPILGVASASKAKSVHMFAKKDHYNDWLFIYLPQFDRGGLLIGPINPNMPPAGNIGGLTPGQMNQGQSGFGQSGLGQSGFGQSGSGQGGFGQGQNGGLQPPPPPAPAPTPQQQ